MFQNIWFVAAIWMGLALLASLISIWAGISVALIEIVVGVFAGNVFHLQANNEWIGFLAMLGSGVLTFLAGAEIDPRSLKANLRASALIGRVAATRKNRCLHDRANSRYLPGGQEALCVARRHGDGPGAA